MPSPTHVPGLILQGTFTAHGGRVIPAAELIHRSGSTGFSSPLAASRLGARWQAWAPTAIVRDNTPGRRLDAQTRHEMESLYGESFADVSVHHSPRVQSLGARAVTLGERIYFGPGEYQPLAPSGAVLLCRELSHVSQQRQLAPLRRCDGVPIVRDPWLEAEASRRGLDLALQRQPTRGRALTVQRMSPLTVGLVVGGVTFGAIALYALGGYLVRRWFSQGARAVPRNNPANTMDPFELAWSVTQDNSRGQPPLGEVLIIAESYKAKEQTGRLLTAATRIIRTYYDQEYWFQKNYKTLDDTWFAWNWIIEDFRGPQAFDTIIARSMICACEEEHFTGGRGPGGGDAISTCGGIGADARAAVLLRVLALLRPGGRAVFTVSRQGAMPLRTRSLARTKSRQYWRPVLDRLPQTVRWVEIEIPHDGRDDEPGGDFFGFVIYRDG